MRTIIDLPADHVEALDDLCDREKISRAEAIRRAVAEHLHRHHRPRAARAFGLWRDRRVDGRTYQTRIRREWEQRG
jgi:hypothetical protein